MTEAGITARPTGRNTPAGKRSRALAADLSLWLRQRRLEGWTLGRLGAAVGHSGHWVRWRIDKAAET
jgi:hypothetical protein